MRASFLFDDLHDFDDQLIELFSSDFAISIDIECLDDVFDFGIGGLFNMKGAGDAFEEVTELVLLQHASAAYVKVFEACAELLLG